MSFSYIWPDPPPDHWFNDTNPRPAFGSFTGNSHPTPDGRPTIQASGFILPIYALQIPLLLIAFLAYMLYPKHAPVPLSP